MTTRPINQHGPRVVVILCLALALLGIAAGPASAQTPGTLTVRLGVVPATGEGRFDLAIDGVVLASGVGDGATTAVVPIASGSAVVSEAAAAGTTLAAYSTAVTCVDGGDVLVAAAPLTATAVEVASGHDVVCAFVNTLLSTPPVVAPPITAKPILLPPAFVRGTAILRGIEGCIARRSVTTRIIGRNILRLVFIRDGRIVKRITAPSLSWRTYELTTVLRPDDREVHTILVRAYFVSGATPRMKAMTHRFSRCRISAVAG